MIRSYFIVALRNLKRRPGQAAVNVFGLAVGMVCCLLIGLYVQDELSFDRFHRNADRLVIIGSEMREGMKGTPTPFPLASILETHIPGVERAIRTRQAPEARLARPESRMNEEQDVLLAEPAFFEAFSFRLRAGDPRTALRAPDGVVISEPLARAYFGDEDPLGKALTFKQSGESYTLTVTGVVEPPPANSTIQFDAVVPLDLVDGREGVPHGWTMSMYDTYALLEPGQNLAELNEQLAAAVAREFKPMPMGARTSFRSLAPAPHAPAAPAPAPDGGPEGAPPGEPARVRRQVTIAPPGAEGEAAQPRGRVQAADSGAAVAAPGPEMQAMPLRRAFPTPTFTAIPLPDFYLSEFNSAEGFKGRRSYLYIFGSVALFVLLIAAINYVNLVTAHGAQRAREVGVRKTMGAGRGQLARQFLSESALLSVAALLIALLLSALLIPAFNLLFDKQLAFSAAEHGLPVLAVSGLVLLVGVGSGFYPALLLARFNPVEALRGSRTGAGGSGALRRVLVVLQFTISVVLIVGTVVIHRQLAYVQDKNLGFSGEQVVLVELPPEQAGQMKEALKERAAAHPGVLQTSIATAVPGRFRMFLGRPVRTLAPQARTDEEIMRFSPALVDYDFIPLLGLEVIAGRAFSRDFPADETRAYVLNRSAAEALGWSPADAVGKAFKAGFGPEVHDGEVIGVVEDFHIASLHEEIQPVLLQMRPDPEGAVPTLLAAKLEPGQITDALRHLEREFDRLAPGEPFSYSFLDDEFDAMYRSEQQLGRIFTTFAGIAIVVACLGLFGLAAFAAERRTKEIGIRKVLGATVSNIVMLMTREFVLLVLVAFAVAAPLGYVAMERWLDSFAYRAPVGPAVFLIAAAVALLIAVATVSVQAIRAALANPVESLRYE